VLAHVPGDSFVAWYLKEHGCGAVVDRLDPAMVVREILRIADDREWMLSLTRNACERALQDFTVESARKTFLSLFAGK
jgi:glycosyltransferase involved in cell wall biosynthesis